MEDLDDDLENHQTSSLGNQTHHVRKIKLKSILNNYEEFQPIIQNAVFRVHDMVVLGYQFLRCFILEKYEDHMKIDRQFMYNILKSVTNNRLITYKEDDIYKPIFDYYNQTFRNHINIDFNNKNLSFIVQYASIEMNTCFENNIMLHFKDYLNKYLNLLFLVPHKDEISKIKNKNERNEKFRNIKNDLTNMKLDLYTNSTFVKYEGTHKEWLENNRHLLVPILKENNINYHLKTKLYDFIKYSIYINKEIENMGFRPYQIVPQRNNNVPKNIMLDHAGLMDLLGNKVINMFNKNELNNCCIIHELKNIENDEKKKKTGKEIKKRKIISIDSVCKADIMLNPVIYRELLFNTLFIKKNKIFSKNKKLFNYTFKTDGISVSLDFVNYRTNKYEKSDKENVEVKREEKEKSKSKKIAIGYGNWSQSSQMKNFFSTPCIGFRHLIHSKFLTITIDEFKTSCKYHKDGSDLDNYKYLKKNKKTKELLKDEKGNHIEISCHKLLTYESTNPTGKINRIFIDRDINGSKNILQCFINKLSNIPRPTFLTRN